MKCDVDCILVSLVLLLILHFHGKVLGMFRPDLTTHLTLLSRTTHLTLLSRLSSHHSILVVPETALVYVSLFTVCYDREKMSK